MPTSLAELKARLAAKSVPAVHRLLPPALPPAEVVAMTTLLVGIERARKTLIDALSGSDQNLVVRTTGVLMHDHAALVEKMAEAAMEACGDVMLKAES